VTAEDSAPTCFLAVAFPSPEGAEDAAGELRALKDLAVRDVAVVLCTPHGRIELQQTRGAAPGEALVGVGTAGLIAGLLLGFPVAGALVGLAGGAVAGLRDHGLPDSRMRELGEDLKPGEALLCVLIDAGSIAQARAALGSYGAVTEVELSPGSEP
jgi:uncharacterized membrane protein